MPYLKFVNDERLNLARGLIRDSSFVHAFGAVPSISVGATGTIWDKNDTLYPWSAWNTPGILTIATFAANGSTSTADNGKAVTIVGLDANFGEITENITISGSTGTGTKVFKRILRAFVEGSTPNATQIRISRGATETARIQIGVAATQMAIYTVPDGYTGYLMQGTCSVQAGGDMTGNMFVRYNSDGTTFRVGHSFEVDGDGGQYFYPFSVPIPLPEHTDIDVRVTARTNNARVTAAFDIIFIKNDGTGLRP